MSAGCTVLFVDRTQGPLNSLGMKATVDQAFDFRDQCYQNYSALQAATNLNVISASSVNLTKLAQDQISNVDFSSLTTWNSAYVSHVQFCTHKNRSSVALSVSPSSKVGPLTSINLATLDVTSLDSAINTNIPSLLADLNTIKTALTSAKTSAVIGDLTTTNVNGNSALEALCVTAYQANLQTVLDQVNTLIAQSNSLSTSCSTLKTQILAIKADATAAIVKIIYSYLIINRPLRMASKHNILLSSRTLEPFKRQFRMM